MITIYLMGDQNINLKQSNSVYLLSIRHVFTAISNINYAFIFMLEHLLRPFLPMPLAVAWVNRLTFSPSSPSPPSSHFQLVVSVRYRKCCGGVWVLGTVCHLVEY